MFSLVLWYGVWKVHEWFLVQEAIFIDTMELSLVRSIIIAVHCIVYWEYEMLLVMMMKCVDVSNVKHT